MGAGHCQWGGLTYRNIYNIYGGAHLASRYRATHHHAKTMSVGPTDAAGQAVMHAMTEGRTES